MPVPCHRLAVLPRPVMLAALVFFSVWLSGCGGDPGTDPISVEALADPTAGGTDELVIEPRKPLRLDFSRKDSFNSESGVLLMRGVYLKYLPESGHLLPGAVGVEGRKEVWHGPVLRLPELEAGEAYAASAWVKPKDTTDSTRFTLVLTRVTDGTSARFELGQVLVEPDQWGKVEGEFIAVAHGGDQIQTLHLDVDSALTDYIIDDISVAYAEFSEELEAAAIEDVEQRVGRFVRNGDAEEGLEPWSHQGGLITRSSVQAHSGQHSILISGRTQGWNAPVMSVHGLEDQIRYKFSIFTRLQKGETPASMKMTMKRVTGGQATYIPIAEATASDSGWVELTGVYISPNISNAESVSLYVESENPTAAYYVDSLTILELR